MMIAYPLLFRPLLKPRVWGDRALERLGKTLPAGQTIGESWELADLPDSVPQGRSIIANGDLAGTSLHEALRDGRLRQCILGAVDKRDEGFPLLIKYLDARQNLSVQVHPSPQYARRHPDAHVKSEAWVVIDADRDAVIYKGLKPNVTREAFAQHIRTNEVVNDLNVVVARPGDCHYLPSGTVHALGAGIVVAEVQTPSDTTFRVYDWGRNEPGRPLHIEQALECIDFSGRPPPSPRLGLPNSRDGLTTTPLTATEHFEIERCDAEAGSSFELITQNLPQVWMMLGGSGRIETSGGKRAAVVDLAAGTTVLIPAAAQSWTARFNASSRLLCVRLPSPLRNMLASS